MHVPMGARQVHGLRAGRVALGVPTPPHAGSSPRARQPSQIRPQAAQGGGGGGQP